MFSVGLEFEFFGSIVSKLWFNYSTVLRTPFDWGKGEDQRLALKRYGSYADAVSRVTNAYYRPLIYESFQTRE